MYMYHRLHSIKVLGFGKFEIVATQIMESWPSKSDLPLDIIIDILLRLPVKSLLRFKSVCKQWYALIGIPAFANQHFSHESNQERLLVRQGKHSYMFSLYDNEISRGCEEPDYLQMPNSVSLLLGPVNGIFFAVTETGNMALLNPGMRQFKPLPLYLDVPLPSYLDFRKHKCSHVNFFGFGVDPLSGYYKIVSAHYFSPKKDYGPLLVSVYNSGSDSWRHIEDVNMLDLKFGGHMSPTNTYLNGVYYWRSYWNLKGSVLAFNMSTEEFEQIQIPDCIQCKNRKLDLTLYGDSIALLSLDYSIKVDRSIDLWVMESKGCWIKSLTFGPFRNIVRSVGFWKKHELLFETEPTPSTKVLTLYDIATQKLTPVEDRIRKNRSIQGWVFLYKESLVSLKGVGDNCIRWDASSFDLLEANSYGCNCIGLSLGA